MAFVSAAAVGSRRPTSTRRLNLALSTRYRSSIDEVDVNTLFMGSQMSASFDDFDTNGRIVLSKDVDDAISRLRGRFKLDGFANTDEAMRAIRGHAPGDPYLPPED